MTKIKMYFHPNPLEITPEDFNIFLEQYSRNESLDSISLCNRIKEDWWNFVDNRKYKEPKPIKKLPDTKCIPKHLKGNIPGIYGVFAKHKYSDFPQCFYVGISERDVKGRIRAHLGKDIRDDYRGTFNWLKECTEIISCYALMPNIDKDVLNLNLDLLESCLTVMLRPRFLIYAAKK